MAKIRSKSASSAQKSVEPGDPRYFIPETFSGKLVDMIPYIIKYPASMETSLMRAARLIVRRGINHVDTENARRLYGDPRLLCWNAFNDMYGIEPVLSRLVANIVAASLNDEQAYGVFTFQGGPSTAKSALANRLKRLFVESEPVLAIGTSKVRAHPLCAIAMIPTLANAMAKSGTIEEAAKFRGDFLKALTLDEKLRFDGADAQAIFAAQRLEPSFDSLCRLASGQDFITVVVEGLGQPRSVRVVTAFPDIAVYEPFMRAARGEAGAGDPVEMMRDLPIVNFRFLDGDEGSVGIATVKETEPFKFDLTEIYGEEDLKHLMKESVDPELTVKLIGAYPVANRGVMEWVEFGKNGLPAIRSILEASQDRRSRYPAPHGTRTLAGDWFIIAHTNTHEYTRLVTTPGNEPFDDRFIRHDVLQPIRADAIRKTLVKQWNRSEASRKGSPAFIAVDPLVFDMCADFLASSRIKLPEKYPLPMLKVVDIISGAHYEPKEAGTRSAAEDVLADLGDLQGSTGLTLRWEQKIIGEMAGLSAANGQKILLSKWVYDWMDARLRVDRRFRGERPENDTTSPPTTELGKLHVFLRNELKKRRARRMARMVRVALKIYLNNQGGGEQAGMGGDLREAYKSRYLDIAQAMLEDPSSVTADDRNFANAIEAEIGVPSSSRETFREAVGIFRNQALDARNAHTRNAREQGKLGAGQHADLPLEAFEPLRRAIDRRIAKDMPPATATAILRATVGAQSQQRQGALDTMARIYDLTPEIAEAYADEVEEKNYLNELGDGEDY